MMVAVGWGTILLLFFWSPLVGCQADESASATRRRSPLDIQFRTLAAPLNRRGGDAVHQPSSALLLDARVDLHQQLLGPRDKAEGSEKMLEKNEEESTFARNMASVLSDLIGARPSGTQQQREFPVEHAMLQIDVTSGRLLSSGASAPLDMDSQRDATNLLHDGAQGVLAPENHIVLTARLPRDSRTICRLRRLVNHFGVALQLHGLLDGVVPPCESNRCETVDNSNATVEARDGGGGESDCCCRPTTRFPLFRLRPTIMRPCDAPPAAAAGSFDSRARMGKVEEGKSFLCVTTSLPLEQNSGGAGTLCATQWLALLRLFNIQPPPTAAAGSSPQASGNVHGVSDNSQRFLDFWSSHSSNDAAATLRDGRRAVGALGEVFTTAHRVTLRLRLQGAASKATEGGSQVGSDDGMLLQARMAATHLLPAPDAALSTPARDYSSPSTEWLVNGTTWRGAFPIDVPALAGDGVAAVAWVTQGMQHLSTEDTAARSQDRHWRMRDDARLRRAHRWLALWQWAASVGSFEKDTATTLTEEADDDDVPRTPSASPLATDATETPRDGRSHDRFLGVLRCHSSFADRDPLIAWDRVGTAGHQLHHDDLQAPLVGDPRALRVAVAAVLLCTASRTAFCRPALQAAFAGGSRVAAVAGHRHPQGPRISAEQSWMFAHEGRGIVQVNVTFPAASARSRPHDSGGGWTPPRRRVYVLQRLPSYLIRPFPHTVVLDTVLHTRGGGEEEKQKASIFAWSVENQQRPTAAAGGGSSFPARLELVATGMAMPLTPPTLLLEGPLASSSSVIYTQPLLGGAHVFLWRLDLPSNVRTATLRMAAVTVHPHSFDSPPDINRLHEIPPTIVGIVVGNPPPSPGQSSASAPAKEARSDENPFFMADDPASEVIASFLKQSDDEASSVRLELTFAQGGFLFSPVPDRSMQFNWVGVAGFVPMSLFMAIYLLTVRENIGDDWEGEEEEH